MIGSTDVATELTADSIASAVWNAIAASFNDAGSMGNKLNTASSGGVDMDALAQTVWEYALRSMPAAERAAVAEAVGAKGVRGTRESVLLHCPVCLAAVLWLTSWPSRQGQARATRSIAGLCGW